MCSCVKGSVPKVGDRVIVEASYNANMPFKWNAVSVQAVNSPQVSVTDAMHKHVYSQAYGPIVSRGAEPSLPKNIFDSAQKNS